jgi:hypothetical protein
MDETNCPLTLVPVRLNYPIGVARACQPKLSLLLSILIPISLFFPNKKIFFVNPVNFFVFLLSFLEINIKESQLRFSTSILAFLPEDNPVI